MTQKIKRQFSRIVLFMVSVLLMNLFFYSCKKKENKNSFTNQAPTAKAGPDISITYPEDSVVLDGSASSDPNGSIGTYTWTKISGASCTLSGSSGSVCTVHGLATGTYVFKLTVMDIFGATHSDEVRVTVDDLYKTAVANIGQAYVDTAVSGTATFEQTNDDSVTLTLDITCLYKANKSVAVHMHMMPDCGAMAANAKGHWNPTKALHGKWGGAPGTFHLGDIGNIPLDGVGHATYVMTTNLWNINGPDTTYNVVNRSIMVHSGVDNYTTQPTGSSGTKIGCGAIQ